MTKKAPGRSERKGIALADAVAMFANERDAEAWFVARRWPNGIYCPLCGCGDRISRRDNRYRCGDCRGYFSVKTGTVMHDSKLSLSKWGLAFYLYSTQLKGVSSMKLHRDLGVTQKTAWHMAHRIREAWNAEIDKLAGEVEVDETFIGGLDKNKHKHKRPKVGRGPVSKVVVVGAKARNNKKVVLKVVPDTSKESLQGFVHDNVEEGSMVYTDEHRAYASLDYPHKVVEHRVAEFVNEAAHTNGIESHWAMLKRGYHGTYHHMSGKHLQRYVNEFAGRNNQRSLDTIDQMEVMAKGIVGKRLRYNDLVAAEGEENDREEAATPA